MDRNGILSYFNKFIVNKHEGDQLKMATNSIGLLRFFNLWPDHGFTVKHMMKSAVKWFLTLHILIITMVMQLVHFLMQNPFQFETCGTQLAGITSWLTADYVKVMFMMHFHKLERFVKNIGDFRQIKKPDDIEYVDNILNLLLKIILYFNYASMCVGCSLKLMEQCDSDDNALCGLVMTSYVPGMDVYKPPYKQIMLIFQCFNGFTHAAITFSISWILLSIAEYLGSLSRELKQMLRKIPNMSTRMQRKPHIKECVRYHYFIISSWEEYINISGNMFLVHMANTSIIMSLIAFQILVVEFQYTAMIHIAMWFLASLICCIFGERLIYESVSVADAAYDSIPWDGDCETAKDLMLIMIRSRKPLYLPGGKFGMIYHVHFMNMMKATYSFLTIMVDTTQ